MAMIIDHHKHQDIYTYNLSVPKKFTLDVPNQSPPYPEQILVKDLVNPIPTPKGSLMILNDPELLCALPPSRQDCSSQTMRWEVTPPPISFPKSSPE